MRIFMHGGDDRVEVRGRGSGIKIRVIGGGGADEFSDNTSGRVFFYDEGNRSRFERGAGTTVDTRNYDAPPSPDPAHRQPPDWGTWTRPIPILSYSPDIGLYAGAGFVHDRYGFRSHPYKSKLWFRAAWATVARVATLEFIGDFRNISRGTHASIDVGISGIEIIRFHGFGNETDTPVSSDFHEVEQLQTRVAPSLVFSGAETFKIEVGPLLKYVSTEPDSPTLLNVLEPYGIGQFGQIGARVGLTALLGTDPSLPSVAISLRGSFYPAVWDVVDPFGAVEGTLTGSIGNGATTPRLAVRLGGKKVWGTFPFYEAAYVGGASTLRGFAEQRFAGDGALYGNAELRVPIGEFPFILPARFGIMGLTDVGRVFLDGEDSNLWHPAFGGGLFFSVLGAENTLSVSAARSEERTGVYVGAGFMF